MEPQPAVGTFEARRAAREVARLIREIQALARELEERRTRGSAGRERDAAERTLERLRWELASAARRAALRDVGAAA